jgi:hypothetical protein
MPDAQVKVYHGEFPDREVTERLKLGDKFLWVPGPELRHWGLGPTLYAVERPNGQRFAVLMPYPVHPSHLVPNG